MNNVKDYNLAMHLSSQAKKDAIQFIHDDVGFNIRMSNLHASIGMSQILNLKKIKKKKQKIHKQYIEGINDLKGLFILPSPRYCSSNNWLNILMIDKKKYGLSKNEIIKKFRKFNIETRSLWYPNHLQKPFSKFEKYDLIKAKKMFDSCICIPSSFSLKLDEQKKIIKLLQNKFQN